MLYGSVLSADNFIQIYRTGVGYMYTDRDIYQRNAFGYLPYATSPVPSCSKRRKLNKAGSQEFV